MVNTHVVRCTTDTDPYLTKGNLYTCHIDQKGRAQNVTCDDGVEDYFMFPKEFEIVSTIEAE